MGEVTPLFKEGDDELSAGDCITILKQHLWNNLVNSIIGVSDILSDFISAYRKNYSSETTLLRLIEDWRASLDINEIVAVILLDLSKAFYYVPHGLLLAKLKAHLVAEPGIALMRNYRTGRSQRVKVGDNVSTWMPVKKGVPQRSILGTFFQCFYEWSFLLWGRSKL